MSSMEAHIRRLPVPDDRWTPRSYPRDELVRGLLSGGAAGIEVSHPMDNVLWKIGRLCEGDPILQFGMTGLAGSCSAREALELVGRAAGFAPDRRVRWGPVEVDPERVLAACEEVGERLALACRRGERVILATGHPTGLPLLYMEVGRLLAARGVELLTPSDGEAWRGGRRGTRREIRYLHGVAVLVKHGSAVHTHSPEPMERMLAEVRPDLVFADHGFAGAAIEAGVETISIADVNDPALIVARSQGRCGPVIVMDDNVRPESYWPCFQAIAAKLS
ncbi:MAG: phosphatase [Actinobacteria bacterium]|nr:phosphatase [Actinomycetota bacterium]